MQPCEPSPAPRCPAPAHADGAGPSVWYPVLAVGLAMVGFIAIKTGRDALFFSDKHSIVRLPWAYLWISLASAVGGMMHLKAMGLFGARRTRVGVNLLFALAFAAVVPFAGRDQPLLMGVLFVAVPVAFAAVFAAAWLLAGDLFEGAPTERLKVLYARIGAGSMVGGIVGGLAAKGVAHLLPPATLFGLGALMLLLVAASCALAHRRYAPESLGVAASISDAQPAEASGAAPTSAHGERALLTRPLVRLLVVIGGLATISAMFIEFQFYAAVAASGSSGPQFFGSFYLLLNVASLVLQLWAGPALQGWLGIAGTLLILPLGVLGAAGAVAVWASLISRSALKVAEAGLKSSIHRSVWEQAFLPIERERRGPAKVLVDGIASRLAEALGAGVLLWWVKTRTPSELRLGWISWTILTAGLLWLVTTVWLRRVALPVPIGASYDPAIHLPDS